MNTDEAIDGVKEIKDKAKKASNTPKSIKAIAMGTDGEYEVDVEQDLVNTTDLKVGDRFIAPEGIGRGIVTVKAKSGNDVIVEYNGQERLLDSIKTNGKVQRVAVNQVSNNVGPNPTVRVSKIMNGQYGYDRTKPQSVGNLLGTDDDFDYEYEDENWDEEEEKK